MSRCVRSAAVVLVCAWTAGCTSSNGDAAVVDGAPAVVADSLARAPQGVRIRVEVLNASGRDGLARRGTLLLRDLGYDVVSYGNAPGKVDTTASTRVQQLAGPDEWGQRVSRALGVTDAPTVRPDPSRYVDVLVLLGHDWTPPPQAFRP